MEAVVDMNTKTAICLSVRILDFQIPQLLVTVLSLCCCLIPTVISECDFGALSMMKICRSGQNNFINSAFAWTKFLPWDPVFDCLDSVSMLRGAILM